MISTAVAKDPVAKLTNEMWNLYSSDSQIHLKQLIMMLHSLIETKKPQCYSWTS